jgi:hypothetical protein
MAKAVSPTPKKTNLQNKPSLFCHGMGVLVDNLWLASGEDAMTVVLHDLLLFSCLAAFVTGIVIATATLII